jgi:hypothetical protein
VFQNQVPQGKAKEGIGMSHTPGPWMIADGSQYRVLSVARDESGDITRCVYICDTANNAKTRTPENKANARLIAAAPELLESLRNVLEDMHAEWSMHGGTHQMVREAIAKATGDAK